jgi:putative ABC transport system substrate-binding protein
MKRREFIGLLGGAAAAWPKVARAQQPVAPVIGFLHTESRDAAMAQVAAFHQGLKEAGYVEGQNVEIEYRWAEARPDRLPALAADLVGRRVTAIAATGSIRAALAAQAATATIPIVFATTIDPMKAGLIASFNRPGGNLTGVYVFTAALGTKWLELLRELAPKAVVFAILVNPDSPTTESVVKDLEAAARTIGQQVLVINASKQEDFDPAFAHLQQQVGAVVVTADNFFALHRDELIALAARYKVPAIWNRREWAEAGGLLSYGNNVAEYYRQVGLYVAQILKGAKPADLPVVQPTKFELVINLKAARLLGLEIPYKVLALADEVIE